MNNNQPPPLLRGIRGGQPRQAGIFRARRALFVNHPLDFPPPGTPEPQTPPHVAPNPINELLVPRQVQLRQLQNVNRQRQLQHVNLPVQRPFWDQHVRAPDTPQMKKGGMVKKTQIVKVHAGEMVIPKNKVASVRKALKKNNVSPY